MNLEEMRKISEAYKKVKEKLDPVGQADADIDNDGDVDKSDKYLHNRRKAIGKAMKKESSCGKMRKEGKVECPKCAGKGCSHCGDTGYHMKEDVEQIDELDTKTLDSYADKASQNWRKNKRTATAKKYQGTKTAADAENTMKKREVGVGRAVDRINDRRMKEEVEHLDELKKSTLASYIKKASRSRSASAQLAKDFDNRSYKPLAKMNRHSPNITGYRNKKGQEKKKSPKKFDKAKSEYDTLKALSRTFGKQADRRQQGIDRAATKLAREEVEIFSEREMQVMIDAGVFEATRADHYKSATPVETMKDKYKGDAADEMAKDHNAHSVKHADITPEEIGHNDAVKAGKATKQSAPRGGADKLSSGAPKTPEKVKKVK